MGECGAHALDQLHVSNSNGWRTQRHGHGAWCSRRRIRGDCVCLSCAAKEQKKEHSDSNVIRRTAPDARSAKASTCCTRHNARSFTAEGERKEKKKTVLYPLSCLRFQPCIVLSRHRLFNVGRHAKRFAMVCHCGRYSRRYGVRNLSKNKKKKDAAASTAATMSTPRLYSFAQRLG